MTAPYAVARDTFCAAHQAWLDAAPPRAACRCDCLTLYTYRGATAPESCDCACHSHPIGRDAAVVYWLLQEHPTFPGLVGLVGAAHAFHGIGCPACHAGELPILEIEEGGL